MFSAQACVSLSSWLSLLHHILVLLSDVLWQCYIQFSCITVQYVVIKPKISPFTLKTRWTSEHSFSWLNWFHWIFGISDTDNHHCRLSFLFFYQGKFIILTEIITCSCSKVYFWLLSISFLFYQSLYDAFTPVPMMPLSWPWHMNDPFSNIDPCSHSPNYWFNLPVLWLWCY